MANDPSTWTELKAALASWADRSDEDIDPVAAQCIALAERRFQREIASPERETTATLPAADAAIGLPDDLWAIRSIFLAGDPGRVLEPVTLAELHRRRAACPSGRPTSYALSGDDLLLAPAPEAADDLLLTYVRTIPPLTADNETNWLLDRHPDLYLHAALVELCTRLRDADGIALHGERTAALIESFNRAGRRRAAGGAPLRIRSPVTV